jgi:hypothetical protein
MEMVLEDHTHPEIAKALGIGIRTVARYIADYKKECLARSEENNAEMVARQLARYNHIYCEAMAAWRRSQQDKQVRTIEDTESGKATGGEQANENGSARSSDPRKKRSVRTEGQAGDAALLARAESAVARICELKGLNAPKQTEMSIDTTKTINASIVVQEVMQELHAQPAFIALARGRLSEDCYSGNSGVELDGGEMESSEAPSLSRREGDGVHLVESGGDGAGSDHDRGDSGTPRQERVLEPVSAFVV